MSGGKGWPALLLVALVATACLQARPTPTAPPPASRSEEPVRGGRLTLPWNEPPRIQPAIHGPRNILAATIYEPFAEFDPVTGEVRPGFATVSQSKDGRTYFVDIDPRALWSDGRPISPADWVTTVKAIARTETEGEWLSEFSEITEIVGYKDYAAARSEEIPGIRIDGARLSVTFERVLCSARQLFALIPPLPTHVFGKYVAPGGSPIAEAAENLTPPVASGPFRLGEWRRGDGIVLVRNDSYWRGAPLLDELVFTFHRFTNEKILELAAGDDVVIGNAPVAILSAIEALGSKITHRVGPPRYEYVGWNTQSPRAPALRDARVRRALAHAIDWDVVVQRIAPHYSRVDSYFPSSSWAFTSTARLEHDPARAVDLLLAAGYAKDGSGNYQKDGVPLGFDIVTNDNLIRKSIAQYAADELSRLGVRVTARVEPFRPLTEKVVRGELDAWVLGWEVTADPGRTQWHSSAVARPGATLASGSLNISQLVDRDLDRALDLANHPPDGDCSLVSRKAHYATALRILAEEQPESVGIAPTNFVAVPSHLRGYSVGTFSYQFRFNNAHLWWLASAKTP